MNAADCTLLASRLHCFGVPIALFSGPDCTPLRFKIGLKWFLFCWLRWSAASLAFRSSPFIPKKATKLLYLAFCLEEPWQKTA